jgi:hypothetical protein
MSTPNKRQQRARISCLMFSCSRSVILIVFACLSIMAYHGVAYGKDKLPLDNDSLVGKYENYVNLIRNISFHSQFQDRVAETSDSFTNTLTHNWKIDLVGKRVWRMTGSASKHTDSATPMAAEFLLTPDDTFRVKVELDSMKATRLTSYNEVPSAYWQHMPGFLYLSFPIGYIDRHGDSGYERIADLLVNAQAQEAGDTLTISSKTVDYELIITLVPSKGFMPERIQYVGLSLDGKVNKLQSSEYRVESSKLIDGVWIPDAFNCKSRIVEGERKLPKGVKIIDGKVVQTQSDEQQSVRDKGMTVVAEVHLSNLSLNNLVDDDFRLRAKIDNGLKVSMQDALHLKYKWQDGEVVPLTDELLALSDGYTFVGSPSTFRFWLFWLTAAAVVVLGTLNVRKHLT